MVRFFLKNKEIKNKTVVFDKEQSKKMRKVLRMKPGDKVEVFDGRNWKYIVELEKITNDFSLGKIIEQEMVQRTTNIVLYQALPKNLKTEIIIQKCTELGVDRIVFWEAEFSQVRSEGINETKIKRWKKVAQDATEQCGRTFIPAIELWKGDIQDEIEVFENTFYLYQDGKYLFDYFKFTNFDGVYDGSIGALMKQQDYNKKLSEISFFVGPEGGFSPKEIKKFEELKVKPIKIAENILRSETAGMAFLAQVELIRNI